MINGKLNLISIPVTHEWKAETLGQAINGCTVVIMFNATTQTFLTHVIGTPHDNFMVECGMDLLIYITRESWWQGVE